MIDYVKVTEEVRLYTQKSVKPKRYEHCVRVAEMMARLCRTYSLDEHKGYLAGIGHDMCKELPAEKMIELAKKDGKEMWIVMLDVTDFNDSITVKMFIAEKDTEKYENIQKAFFYRSIR